MTRQVSRLIYAGMLWWMRRRFVRRLQRASIDWLPERVRVRARENFLRQERFARRIGLAVVTAVVNFFFVMVAATLLVLFVLNGVAEGWIVIPTREAVLPSSGVR